MKNQLRLSDQKIVASLPTRDHPHWNILEYCRHLGIARNAHKPTFWVARVRLKNGSYKQVRIAAVRQFHEDGIEYPEALDAARKWFASPEVVAQASAPYAKGINRKLIYTKSMAGFTIGDALVDFIEWKRVAASPAYFDTTLSFRSLRCSGLGAGGHSAKSPTQFRGDPGCRKRRANRRRLGCCIRQYPGIRSRAIPRAQRWHPDFLRQSPEHDRPRRVFRRSIC